MRLKVVVFGGIFFGDRSRFFKLLVGQFLGFGDSIDIGGHSCQYTDCACPIEAHIFENRHQRSKSVLVLQGFQDGDDGLVGIVFQQVGELFDLQIGVFREFGRVFIEFHNEFLKRRACHFHFHCRLVKARSETDDVCRADSRLCGNTGKPLSEVYEIGFTGGGCLTHGIDGRSNTKQGFFNTHALCVAKHIGNLAKVADGSFTQVFTQGHLNLVGSADKSQNIFLAANTEFTGIACQEQQLFTAGARVNLHQGFVQSFNFLMQQPRRFHHIGVYII